jgi:hypothetical protein
LSSTNSSRLYARKLAVAIARWRSGMRGQAHRRACSSGAGFPTMGSRYRVCQPGRCRRSRVGGESVPRRGPPEDAQAWTHVGLARTALWYYSVTCMGYTYASSHCS